MMKFIFALLGGTCFLTMSFGQDIKIKTITNEQIVKLLNNIEVFANYATDDLNIRVFKLGNESGSAGGDSGEATHDLYVAVSEYGDYALQKLYTVGSMYNPKYIKWDNKNSKQPELTIEIGNYKSRQTITLQISLEKLVKKH